MRLVLVMMLLFGLESLGYGQSQTSSLVENSTPVLHTIHIVPQSHIDVVWLWRYDPETIHRCCKVTFTQALNNLDRFPDYTFAQSQVPLYEPLEKIYPDLYRRIKEYIREGRWEIVGGMYVEPEGGEPCGESWVRQCVMGKRWFQTHLGVDVTTGWQPDAWGHPSQLPQILRKSGMDSYLWRRGDVGGPRNNVTEKMFWWQAPDGSKVLAFRFPETDDPPFSEWERNVRICQDRYHIQDSLLVMGRGDHGGGPSEKDIQVTHEFARNLPPGYAAKFGTFHQYVETVLRQNPHLPTIQGDLGWELQADLTNVGEIKKSNRECENLLISSEKWASIAAQWFSFEYPREELDEAWKKLLFNQFHDILGGSLIPEAIDDAMQGYQSIRDSGEYTSRSALGTMANSVNTEGDGQPVLVFNPLSWKRTDVVEAVIPFSHTLENISLQDALGNRIPVQIVEKKAEKGKTIIHCVFIAPEVPPLGYKTFYIQESTSLSEISSSLSARENQLENDLFQIGINTQNGSLNRFLDKQNQREILAENSDGNQLIAIKDEGDSEGRFVLKSDIIGKPPGAEEAIQQVTAIRVMENGPVRAKLRIEKQYQNSRFSQDVILYPGIDRVDFSLYIDWHDIHRMIKIAFPFSLPASIATYDVPYGTSVRPADGLEYPAQKWVDLSEKEYGVSLMNRGRYAHDVQKSTVRMSILRSPTHPANNTDEGIHTLDYALYPHKGSWNESWVVQRGEEFNFPLTAVLTGNHSGTMPQECSFITVTPEPVLLDVVKKSYDSNQMVLRFYEKMGQTVPATVSFFSDLLAAQETDLLENDQSAIPVLDNRMMFTLQPHEIKTVQVLIK